MAPEVMQAGKYTTKADVFSLSVILWEIFTSEEPWKEAISVRAIESAILSGKRQHMKGLSGDIRNMLMNMWADDPKMRPTTSAVVYEIESIAYKEGYHATVSQMSRKEVQEVPWKSETIAFVKPQSAPKRKAPLSHSKFDAYLTAYRNGDVAASYNIGLLYSEGQGGAPRDLKKAAEYYQVAANSGDAKAQSNLALLYYEGTGVPQDLTQAARYFQLAANQGDPVAQRNLGVLYQSGLGVLKDWELAKKYYRMAANQDDDIAFKQLSIGAKGESSIESIWHR
jgi:hypothetical protein